MLGHVQGLDIAIFRVFPVKIEPLGMGRLPSPSCSDPLLIPSPPTLLAFLGFSNSNSTPT